MTIRIKEVKIINHQKLSKKSISAFLFIIPLMMFLLSACSSDNKDKHKIIEDTPVEILYNKAMSLMGEKKYIKASTAFEEVERQHPYSAWATRAQLMTGYALYKAMSYDDAVIALEQFIQLHPGNKDVAYAYYLAALCDYERLADVRRDQSFATNALSRFETIISRFPNTTYAKDAVLKTALIHDHLAGAEMEIGRNYLKQKLYTAAIGRFKTVVEKYQTTSHVPEALHRLVECYLTIGIISEAKIVAAVLGHNFPGSPWYLDSYNLLVDKKFKPEKDSKSWIKKLWNKI